MAEQTLFDCAAPFKQKRLDLTCEWCGASFHRFPSNHKGKKHAFCGTDCSRAWQRKNAPSGEAHCQFKSHSQSVCRYCGKTFLVPRRHGKHKGRKCCSPACRLTAQRCKWGQLFSIAGPVAIRCAWCHAPLQRSIKRAASMRQFCNLSCRSKYHTHHYRGSAVYCWRGGNTSKPRGYGPGWFGTSRYIDRREGRTCPGCKSTCRLSAHHIVSTRFLRQQNLECLIVDRSILIGLCTSCHARVESRGGKFGRDKLGRSLQAYVEAHPEWFAVDRLEAVEDEFRRCVYR